MLIMINPYSIQNHTVEASQLSTVVLKNFAEDNIALINSKQKTRLLVRCGKENNPLRLDDIAFAYTEHRIVVIVDRLSRKYIYNQTLSQLEEELCTNMFFRTSRQ